MGVLWTSLGPLLAVGGFALYFVAVTRFALWRDAPWEFLGIVALGVALAVWRLARAPGVGTGLAAACAVGVLGFSSWYWFGYSQYGPREAEPGVGDRFPDFTLPDSRGGSFRLAEALRQRDLVLLFYRGDW